MQLLLINLLFLLLMIFIYILFLHDRKIERENRKLFIGLFAFLAIIFCKQFQTPMFFGEIFEWMYIPFLLGAIYGGRKVALSLFCWITILNIFFGTEHLVSSLIICALMLLTILILLLPYYHKLSKLKKVVLLMVVPIFFSGITIIFNFTVMKDILDNFGLFLLFGLVEAISVGLIVFIIEFIRESTIIKEEYFEAEKLRVVSELAASVSHEVKNPLTVTRGFIQLLHDPNLNASKKAEFLELSLHELDRAQEIITDYLNLAKPASIIKGQVHDLSLELEYVAKVMKPLALLQGVEIVTIAKTECFISGDCQKLRQCFINIVKNGIEAMENGGVLTIQLFCLTDEIMISIHDTGVGMSKKQIESLGVAFQTTKVTGTGLGLMVVYNIVRIMGGRIEIESIEGKGTTFKLFFPQAR